MSVALMLAAALALAPGCDLEAPSGEVGCARDAVDALPINALQAVGTHNSYKLAIPEPEMALLRAMAPDQATALDYAHRQGREDGEPVPEPDRIVRMRVAADSA